MRMLSSSFDESMLSNINPKQLFTLSFLIIQLIQAAIKNKLKYQVINSVDEI